MRPLFVIVLLALTSVSPWSARASTFDTGVPSLVLPPGTLGPCAIFQVTNLNTFFALPASADNYRDAFAFLAVSQLTGKPVTFTDAGTTVSNCQGYELATDVRLGTPPCFNATGLDFTIQCNAIEAVLGVF